MTPEDRHVFPVLIEYVKKVTIYVEAETSVKASALAERCARDVDVDGTVGSDFDATSLTLGPVTTLSRIAGEAPYVYVWREDEKWPLCDEAYERYDLLQEEENRR